MIDSCLENVQIEVGSNVRDDFFFNCYFEGCIIITDDFSKKFSVGCFFSRCKFVRGPTKPGVVVKAITKKKFWQ